MNHSARGLLPWNVVLILLFTGCGGGSSSTTQSAAITISVSPSSATLQAGANQQFTATVQNDPANKGVTWAISPSTGAGTLSGPTSTSVTYIAPSSAPNEFNVTVTATSVTDASKSASATLTIRVPKQSGITVSVNPPTAKLSPGGAANVFATVGNDPTNSGVNWAISPTAGSGALQSASTTSGMINVYTAPSTLSSSSLTNARGYFRCRSC